MNVKELKEKINGIKCNSAWSRGVRRTALDLLNWVDMNDDSEVFKSSLEKTLLNGSMQRWQSFA